MTSANTEPAATVVLPPGEPTKGKKRRTLPDFLRVPWGIWSVVIVVLLWLALQIVLTVALVLLSPSFPAIASFLSAASKGEVVASLIFYLAEVVIAFALVAGVLRHYHASWQAVGWRRFSAPKAGLYFLLIFIGFLVLANVALLLVKVLVPGFDPNQAQTNEFTQGAAAHRNLALIAVVLLPPIFEETIFRGFVFPAIAKRTGIIWGALLSSMLFGLAHGQPNLFVYTTILGLLLCFMYRRLGSIIPGILLHMLNNYLAFLAITSK